MRTNALRNKETYNLTAQPEDPPIHAQFNKGVLKNLREQSPFREGARNKDWINPTLSSNVLFYNHGKEEASNHHIQAKKQNKKGYDLNHYVAYDVEYTGPAKQAVNVQAQAQAPLGRDGSTDGQLRRTPSSSQKIDAEAARNAAPERPKSPVTSEQRISVDRGRSPVEARSAVKVQARVELQERVIDPAEVKPARPASPIQQEQRSSSRIERGYDRSQRSGSANADRGGAALNKSASQQNIRTTQQQTGRLVTPLDPAQEKQGMTRSQSAVSIPGQYGEYLRATASNISNPDALVCDYCVNEGLHNIKVQEANAYRRQEIEHAAAIQEELKRQLEDERRRHYEKTKAYQEQIEGQRADLEERQAKNRALQDEENRKVRNLIEENNQKDWVRAQKLAEQKARYVNELGDQLERNYAARQDKYFKEQEAEKRNDNLLINDAARAAQQAAVKDQYKKNIRSQLEDQMRDKEGKKDVERAENDAYRKRVQEMITKDIEARRNMDKAKKKAFVDEVDRHVAMREEVRAWEAQGKAADLELLRQKQALERQRDAEKNQAKRAQMSEYIKTLGAQIADKQADRQAKAQADRQPMNGTLIIPQKVDRCFNCVKCRHQYPLKLLNKQKRVARAV